MKNIHNAVSDVEDFMTANHFPVVGKIGETVGDWTIVEFSNNNNDFLRLEFHNGDYNVCVLDQRGFTNDQRRILMDTFMLMMFPE